MSSSDRSTNENELQQADDQLLDPYKILQNLNPDPSSQIPLPTTLSPTSLELFAACPQAFFFQYILKLKPDPPITPALVRGTVCHTALEEVFDLHPENRTLVNLENLFRRAWKKKRGERDNEGVTVTGETESGSGNECDILFRTMDGQTQIYDIEAEKEWGKHSLQLLRNYFELEDPRSILRPNPAMREMWVHAQFGDDGEPLTIRGIIDRIDMFVNEQAGKVQLQIIDYKTGKKPHFKYSPAVNERIEREQNFKMRVYALVLWKMIIQTNKSVTVAHQYSDSSNLMERGLTEENKQQYKYRLPWELQQKLLKGLCKDNIPNNVQWDALVEFLPLRLFYLTSHPDDESANDPSAANEIGKASYLDTELTPNLHDILQETEEEVLTIWKDLKDMVDRQDPLAFQHCDKKFCNCHEMRRRFHSGSVWSSH